MAHAADRAATAPQRRPGEPFPPVYNAAVDLLERNLAAGESASR